MAAAERPLVGGGLTGASSRALLRVFGQPRLEPRPMGFAVDDEIVGVAGQAIDGALRAHRIGEGGQPFVRATIRSDDDRAGAIPLQEEVVEVATLDRIEDIDREIIEDEEIDGDEFPEFGFVAVIEPRVLQQFQHLVGAAGQHGGAAPARDMAERVCKEGLADADGADDRHMGVTIEKAQRGELVEERTVKGGLSRSYPSSPNASSDPSGPSGRAG